MAAYIEATLSKRFPPHAARFRENRKALDAKLQALDEELRNTTAPLKAKPFAVYHDAIQYFEHRYGLKAVGSILIAQDVAPGGKRLTDLRRQIAKLNALCVFAEPQSDPRMLQAVAEGSTARMGVLDAEGLALEPGPDLYFTLMRGLAKSLRACLAPDA
jgi:zinc transport system substrate-binding protein